MEITVFAKKKQTKAGKTFYVFLTTLTKKDGSEQKAVVKFKEGCAPLKAEDCPVNIIIEKEDANMSQRTYTDAQGDEKVAYTLWLSKYVMGTPYVDSSMDDYF